MAKVADQTQFVITGGRCYVVGATSSEGFWADGPAQVCRMMLDRTPSAHSFVDKLNSPYSSPSDNDFGFNGKSCTQTDNTACSFNVRPSRRVQIVWWSVANKSSCRTREMWPDKTDGQTGRHSLTSRGSCPTSMTLDIEKSCTNFRGYTGLWFLCYHQHPDLDGHLKDHTCGS